MKKIQAGTKVASGFSVADYHELRKGLAGRAPSPEAWTKIVDVFMLRLDERYLQPIQHLDKWDPLESTCRHASLSIL